MPKPNHLSVLRLPLPALKRDKPLGFKRQIKASTKTREVAPLAAWQSPSVDYIKLAQERYFPTLVELSAKAIDLQEPVGSLNKNNHLETESEVLNGCHGILVQPVLLCVQHLFSGGPPSAGLTIRHSRESHGKQDGRIDLVWEYIHSSNLNKLVPFAVLEFKNTCVIHPEEFAPRFCGPNGTATGSAKSKEWFQQTTENDKDNPLQKSGNPAFLAKQATQYAYRTPFISMFDWDTMLTMDFRPLKISKGQDFVQMRFLREFETGGKDGQTFGMLLLGYVVHALQETLKANGHEGPYLYESIHSLDRSAI